jgi:DNA repair protein RecO (recombination protein O)
MRRFILTENTRLARRTAAGRSHAAAKRARRQAKFEKEKILSTFKDKGIVIKEYFTGEYDKNMILLLKDKGKVTVFVKGARKPKSKFFAAAQLFSYCEFVIFDGNGFLSLAQADVIHNFYAIARDYDKFCAAGYFLELAGEMILPAMPAAEALYLLIKSLNALSKDLMDQRLVKSVFEIKFMQMEGYSPQLDECISCGEYFTDAMFFEPQGVICRNCIHNEPRRIRITDRTIAIIKYILNTNIKDLFKIKVSETAAIENLQTVSAFFVSKNL